MHASRLSQHPYGSTMTIDHAFPDLEPRVPTYGEANTAMLSPDDPDAATGNVIKNRPLDHR